MPCTYRDMQHRLLREVPFRKGRHLLSARAEAGKGFGARKIAQKDSRDKPRKRAGLTNEEAIQRALQVAEGKKASPVDQKEASVGRIDYAKVKDWRAKQNGDAGTLEVESFVPGEQGKDVPLYNELTMAAVNSQQSGQVDDLMYNQFEVPARRDLPAQENWSYQIRHYMQYLVDLQATHHILESGIAEALAVHQEDNSTRRAVECFSEQRGLDRSLEIAADLNNLDSDTASAPSVSPAAAAYVAYLTSLAQNASEAPDQELSQKACLRLITHAYCAQLQHLTNGSKLGAKIAELRNLFAKKAVNMYRRYPHDIIGRDPVVALQQNVNTAGTFLSAEEKTVMKMEVPIALAHTNQLFEALACTD